jgi:hypothetical protein
VPDTRPALSRSLEGKRLAGHGQVVVERHQPAVGVEGQVQQFMDVGVGGLTDPDDQVVDLDRLHQPRLELDGRSLG